MAISSLQNFTDCKVSLPKAPITPIATTFINLLGETTNRFFKNNPWKLSSETGYQKIYRFCIVCGDNRFTDKDWNDLDSMWGQILTNCCRKITCFQALDLHKGIPRPLEIVDTNAEQLQMNENRTAEHFEEIGEVTFKHPFSTGNREEMPAEYLEKFREFKKYPFKIRLQKINDMHFDYLQALNIPPRLWRASKDEFDPFLKRLAIFREKLTELAAFEERMREIQVLTSSVSKVSKL